MRSLTSDRNLRFSEAVVAFVLKEGLRSWRFHPRTVSELQKAKQAHHCIRNEISDFSDWQQKHQIVVNPAVHRATEVKRVPARYVQGGMDTRLQ